MLNINEQNLVTMKKTIALIIAVFAVFTSYARKETASHVFFIGLDSWGSYSMAKADMPNVRRLMENGSYTLKKRTTLPSHSASNWASMFMGASPEIHGFCEWGSKTPDLVPRVTSEDGIFPTIFNLLRDKDPDAEIGAFYEWDGIKYLIDTLAMSRYETVPQDQLSDSARNYILTKKPKLAAFVFDDPDHVGHAIGHDTEALYAKLTQLDGWIGEILDAIEQAGIMDKSIIILTSDHGGIGKGHGGRTMEEMETPFVIYGKGVRKGYCFDDISVMQFDVASTMAYIFNLKQPQAWFGRPVKSIFK